jgi:hypothetical protein
VGANAILLLEDDDDADAAEAVAGFATTATTSDGVPINVAVGKTARLSDSVHGLALYVP